jgi:hypothetical protein
MIKFFQNLALFRVQNANFFANFFGENILKIMTSVPECFSPIICVQNTHVLEKMYSLTEITMVDGLISITGETLLRPVLKRIFVPTGKVGV